MESPLRLSFKKKKRKKTSQYMIRFRKISWRPPAFKVNEGPLEGAVKD